MIFGRRRVEPDTTPRLGELVALSMETRIPKPTGDPMADHWNDAISCAQAYLNGRAVNAESGRDRSLILAIRADLNWLHMRQEDVES